MSFPWHTPSLGFSINMNRLPSDNSQERKIRFKIDPLRNVKLKKPTPSSIYTRFNTRYVKHLFSYTDTLFEWSQMKIIKLEFPIFLYEAFFMFKTSLLLLIFCLCVYVKSNTQCLKYFGLISNWHVLCWILSIYMYMYTHCRIYYAYSLPLTVYNKIGSMAQWIDNASDL